LDSGIQHSHLRRYLVPTLSAGLKQYFDGISGMVNKLLFKLDDIYSECTSENQFVNLSFVMKLLSFDMFGEIAMNYDFGALDTCDFMKDSPGDRTSTLLLAVDYLSGYTRDWALLSSVPLVGSVLTIAVRRKIKKALSVIHAFFNEIFDRRQTESPRTYKKRHQDILDVLIDAKKEGVMFEKEDVVHHLIAFIFSGCHTVSSLLFWTLVSILKNSHVEEKILNELTSVMGPSGVDVEYQHLDKMTYMNTVLMETMRLYPQFPVVTRQAIDDCVVNGYQFPRGTHVLINCYSMHRDPKYWTNPEEFNPDLHFAEDSTRHPYAFLPYSFGDRKCLGEHLSKFQAKITLSMLLRNFKVEFKDRHQEITPIVHSVLMDVKEDVMVRFVPRLEHSEEG
jgi:cytochrome P450